MKHPEITWSLMHPTPLDPEYFRRMAERTKDYHVDSFEICGLCHTPYGGLDGLITYDEYPHARASWDQARVADDRAKLTEILSIAHEAGKKVYLWHREVMLPSGLLTDLPELLDDRGEFDLLGKTFADLIRYKLDRAFAALPGLDGVVLTLTEADFSAIHNSDTAKYPPEEVVRFIVEIFASTLAERGKFFSMRSFGSIAEDYRCILAGIEKLAGKYHFEVETKITPYDFVPFLPPNPFLHKSTGCTLAAECDCLGEFLGQGFMPFEHAHNLVRYVREGQAADVDRFVIRMDRRGNCVLDLYEQNYYAYDRALHDPAVTADVLRREWYGKHEPAACGELLARLDKIGWEMVCATYFIDRQVLFHGNYSMKYLKAAFVFALFGPAGRSLANGKDIWSILTERTTPGRAAILAEKDRAVALADEGRALLKTAGLPPENYRHRLWENAAVITRAVRELVRCICAYFDDMEQNEAEAPRLKAQLAASAAEFARLAGHAVQTRQRQVVNGLEHRFNEVTRSLEVFAIEPLAAICQEFPAEYAAEYAAKRKFLPGAVDGIITGAVTDDWRIARYMHASHAALHNGLPSRWAGNRVFPNGFMEMELKRGAELVIYGDAETTRRFTLICDGKRIAAAFDEKGVFALPLPAGKDTVSVRLEKEGTVYPVFHAVITRN